MINGVNDSNVKVSGTFHVIEPVLTETDGTGVAVTRVMVHIGKRGTHDGNGEQYQTWMLRLSC